MSSKKICVIAGTPVDTQMGVDFLLSKGLYASPHPVAKSVPEFEMASNEARTNKVREILNQIKSDGMNSAMIYCNALSSTVDMDQLSEEFGVKIITPLHVYKQFAVNYCTLGVIAGNNQALAGIERAIVSTNKDCYVIGLSMLPLIVEIETKESPDVIMEKFALMTVLEMFNRLKIGALILGCTHLPYLYNELIKYTDISIIDPAESMYQLLV